jgi:hypothetical protein
MFPTETTRVEVTPLSDQRIHGEATRRSASFEQCAQRAICRLTSLRSRQKFRHFHLQLARKLDERVKRRISERAFDLRQETAIDARCQRKPLLAIAALSPRRAQVRGKHLLIGGKGSDRHEAEACNPRTRKATGYGLHNELGLALQSVRPASLSRRSDPESTNPLQAIYSTTNNSFLGIHHAH